MNERKVTINSEGVLSYFHFENPREPKAKIDLSSQVVSVRCKYTGYHR